MSPGPQTPPSTPTCSCPNKRRERVTLGVRGRWGRGPRERGQAGVTRRSV